MFPELSNVIGGCGIRVPVANGSLTDITFNVEKTVSIEDINNAFKIASENELQRHLGIHRRPNCINRYCRKYTLLYFRFTNDFRYRKHGENYWLVRQ